MDATKICSLVLTLKKIRRGVQRGFISLSYEEGAKG